jgi:L-lactate dehydrogenase complex protein LldE
MNREEDISGPRVGLFVTCLVDLVRPSVGFAAVELLQAAGCRVDVPQGVTCCGQPAYNSGDLATARTLARRIMDAYAPFDYVVAPSGSCAAMLRHHYPQLFEADAAMRAKAEAFAAKVHELTCFLADVVTLAALTGKLTGKLAYHDSCAGLRELGIREQPRRLLARIEGVEVAELAERDACCGFGGTFCVKYPEISNAMVDNKAKAVAKTGASLLVGGDLGCLMNIAGKLAREGSTIEVRHVAEVLAGIGDTAPVGGSKD